MLADVDEELARMDVPGYDVDGVIDSHVGAKLGSHEIAAAERKQKGPLHAASGRSW